MNQEYGKVIDSALDSYKRSNGQKYRLKISGVQAGDEDFNKTFEEIIKKRIQENMKNNNAVLPEYDGMILEEDKSITNKTSDDFIKLRTDMFKIVFSAFHIPESMMSGNITNMKEIVSAFLSFGVDPFADTITEALNKRAGIDNYLDGNFYRVDTGKIHHRDIFDIATGVSNLISSSVMCVDEIREELGMEELDETWSKKHFITKNFEEIEKFLNTVEGGE
jgi:HK97 family phage portal protein